MIKHLRFLKTLKNWQVNLLLFITLSIVVFFIEYSLLSSVFKQSLTGDDWRILFEYKTYGTTPLGDVMNTWKIRGAYVTSYFYYIGILESLFGINYQAFHIINIFFKTVATLLIFPLVLVIFKRTLLACLATIIFAISYSSTGPLQYVVKGVEYLAISSMLIFFISYYHTFKFEKGKTYHVINAFTLLVPSLLLLLTLLLSPIRLYPLLVLLPAVELFLWIQNRTLGNLKKTLIILASLFLPIYWVSKLNVSTTWGYLIGLSNIYHQLINGNWQLILTPFSGLGYTILTNDLIWSFDVLSLIGFKNDPFVLLNGFILIYIFLTILLSFILSKNPRRFFFSVFSINLFIEVIFLYFYQYRASGNLQPGGFISTNFYPASFGVYMIIVSIFTFLEWLNRKKDRLLIILTGSIVFSFIFIWSTWLILGPVLNFIEPIHWYLVMPSLGASFFIAVLLVIFYDKSRRIWFTGFKEIIILLILILLYQLSYREINRHFDSLLAIGAGAKEQQFIQGKIIEALKNNLNHIDDPKPALFYFDFDALGDQQSFKFYEVTLNIGGFEYWVHLQRNHIPNGCVGSIFDKKKLLESIVTKDNQRGFTYDSICVKDKYGVGWVKVFYDPKNFYAFKLRNRDIFDIKKDLLKDLGF